MKLKEARTSRNILQKDAAIAINVDNPLYSKMEKGICNPTPEQFSVLCRIYHKMPHELCKPEDVDYGLKKGRAPSVHNGKVYNLHVRIPRALIGSPALLHAMVRCMGYEDMGQWAIASISALQAAYMARQRETASDGSTSKAV